MASPITNWVHERGIVTEKDRIALERAKKMEAKEIKKGYRWYKIDNRTKILVECDKDGNPTERGLECIERYKSMFYQNFR
jgi:hypothetical protein